MNLYVSTADIKTYLGITGSSKDGLIAMLNKQATSMVTGILGSSDLSLHAVYGERHDAMRQFFQLTDRHVVHIGKIIQNVDTVPQEYTQTAAYDIQDNVLHLKNYLLGGYRTVTVDYAAGWNASGVGVLEVKDITGLSGATISVGGHTITEAIDWDAETDNYTTAQNIADALNANSSIASLAKAFACGAKVFVVDKVVGQEDTVSISTSALVNYMALTAAGGKLTGIDMPEGIKGAIMMYVSVLFNSSKNPKLVSYTIGTKRVQFASDSDFTMFKDMLAPFRNVSVHAI